MIGILLEISFLAQEEWIMKVISLDKVAKAKVELEGAENAFKQIPISKADGAPLFSFRVFTIESGGHTPYHQHPYEHVNYVMEGQGFLVSENGNEQEIRQGDFALILPNEMHQYRNEMAEGRLVIICAVPKEFE